MWTVVDGDGRVVTPVEELIAALLLAGTPLHTVSRRSGYRDVMTTTNTNGRRVTENAEPLARATRARQVNTLKRAITTLLEVARLACL